MTDRELLELAAKAVGIKISQARQSERDAAGYGDVGLWTTTATNWNPLTDDGDALRLLVHLNLELAVSEIGAAIKLHKMIGDTCGIIELIDESMGKQEATRRAIVRAAAEIGKGAK